MEEIDPKKPRERSKEYPLFTQKFCIEFAETVNSKLGNRFSSADLLARTFGKAITALGSRLSSCKQYDLLELKKGDGYKPTEKFYKITRGRTDEDKREALIQSLKNPTIYNDVIEKYDGIELPTDLPSIFYWDYGITEGAKDTAAKIFIENLQDLDLISTDGKLIISKKPIEGAEIIIHNPDADTPPYVKPPVIPPVLPITPPAIGNKKADVKISNGRFVTIEFPADITSNEIDRLIKNLELWKD